MASTLTNNTYVAEVQRDEAGKLDRWGSKRCVASIRTLAHCQAYVPTFRTPLRFGWRSINSMRVNGVRMSIAKASPSSFRSSFQHPSVAPPTAHA